MVDGCGARPATRPRRAKEEENMATPAVVPTMSTQSSWGALREQGDNHCLWSCPCPGPLLPVGHRGALWAEMCTSRLALGGSQQAVWPSRTPSSGGA